MVTQDAGWIARGSGSSVTRQVNSSSSGSGCWTVGTGTTCDIVHVPKRTAHPSINTVSGRIKLCGAQDMVGSQKGKQGFNAMYMYLML